MNFILILAFFFPIPQHTTTATLIQQKTDTASIDTSSYAVLPFNPNRDSFIFSEHFKPANISADDIKKIEKIISVTVAEHNKQSKSIISKPGKYYKQIIAVTNANGQKEVWVNCFCTPYEKRHWRKGVVLVLDGGPCFFNIKINLSTTTVMSLAVNGVA
ncbi:hypothetical protein IDJ77_09495 [Mucilaginibacter sp. ZT4R22]|uniref:Uncharacterized protein n=1 Tax=Mucilaginibacter pankratovii TaxID=2772110 RepID=A0ABR7WPB7_9SPHI|nr:hypothetical protein [Mucilaginibacter pankratovii]MBD1364041.1 hypothetical protein [Mucilaginibacter pankratovii]